jgi:hypothetical protein
MAGAPSVRRSPFATKGNRVLGFQEGAPVFVKVSFSENEVEMLDGEQTTYGLRAATKDGDQVTRWFVPWSAVSYIRQDIPSTAPATAPTTLPGPAPSSPPVDDE